MVGSSETMQKEPPLVRGLATLALLKANFDCGVDHIDMIEPLVLDCIAAQSTDDFSVDMIKACLLDAHGLRVPAAAVRIALTRAKRERFLFEEGGRYFRTERAGSLRGTVAAQRSRIEGEQAGLARSLMAFLATISLPVASEEDALALLFSFLSQFHLPLLLDGSGSGCSPLPVASSRDTSDRELRAIALFLTQLCLPDDRLRPVLQRMLEGFVLQNALLLRDINLAARKFQNLVVFFDTGFLLQALGLEGEASAVAAREVLDALRATNASLAAFEKTVEEIRRILSVYEQHLGTTQGISSLRPTRLTRYLVTHRFSPSDVRQLAAMIESQIRGLGVSIRRIPLHDRRYTLDEAALARLLRSTEQNELHPRVVHDVDCVAAVVTLRQGHSSWTYDNARAVFATTTGLLVKNVREWHVSEGQAGLPPAVHCLALSSAAWIKKPTLSAELNMRELVALCSAALAPSRRVWELFLEHLRRLIENKQITSDEMVAVIASELTDSLLGRFEDDTEPDAASLSEVVERVVRHYASDADARIREAEGKTTARIALAEAETAEHEEARRKSEEKLRVMVLALRGKARRLAALAGRLSLVFFVLAFGGAGVLVALGLRSLPGVPGWVTWTLIAGFAFAGYASVTWGSTARQWSKALERRVESFVRRLLGVA